MCYHVCLVSAGKCIKSSKGRGWPFVELYKDNNQHSKFIVLLQMEDKMEGSQKGINNLCTGRLIKIMINNSINGQFSFVSHLLPSFPFLMRCRVPVTYQCESHDLVSCDMIMLISKWFPLCPFYFQ